ncbi:hypothetical protein GCM10009676_45440 [Prauserella halophila]|uniref:CRISPR-associated protein Csb2 n=1 Tax=Prauserella halophila TaxID=185641 RepID=A0ABP4HC16_9PSEU|nr:hypothetical protein [Prauserella halophila]MCP2237596.1 hypothetical protein [Prauserella halophila]
MIRLRLHNPGRVWTASTGQNGGRSAWPVSPWTVLAALVNGAHLSGNPDPARAAIAELAADADPWMWLPEVADQTAGARYVGPTGPQPAAAHHTHLDASRAIAGATDRRTKHQLLEARTEWSTSTVFLDFPDVLTTAQLGSLADAARATPYVGRATDEVTIGVLSGQGGDWWDHTADELADPAMSEPGADHRRHVPTDLAGSVRCTDSDFLDRCDLDHQRRQDGIPGLSIVARGRGVRYVQTTDRTSGAIALVLDGKRTAGELYTALEETGEPVPFLLGSNRRPWGALFPDVDAASRMAGAVPHLFTGDEPRTMYVNRWHGTSATSWRTVAPVAGHPDRRRITAELEATSNGHVSVRHVGACPELPHLSLWHVALELDQPHPGPIQYGDGWRFGYGRFRKSDEENQ